MDAESDVVASAAQAASALAGLHPEAYALSKRRVPGPALERALGLISQKPIPGEVSQ